MPWMAYKMSGLAHLVVVERIIKRDNGWYHELPFAPGTFTRRTERDGQVFDTLDECLAACDEQNVNNQFRSAVQHGIRSGQHRDRREGVEVHAPGDRLLRDTMPKKSRYLDLQVQNQQPTLWALVDPDSPQELKKFEWCGTGHQLCNKAARYLGTAQLEDGALVLHLFEC